MTANAGALVAGVWEFPERKTTRSALDLQALSAVAALEEAGLTLRDVDGFATAAGSGGSAPLPILH